MGKSQKNNSKLSRFVYYKYSGPIVFVPLIILSIGLYVYMETEQEFFSAWSCETISNYLLDVDVPDDFPSHNDLTESQHLKLHGINDECNRDVKFLDKKPHA